MIVDDDIITTCEVDSYGFVEPTEGHEFSKFPIKVTYSWSGTVVKINDDSFDLELYDPLEDQFAETQYPISKLKYHQRQLLQLGAQVYLYAGNNKDTGEGEHILLFRKYQAEKLTLDSIFNRIQDSDIRANIIS